ncbi:glycoside hydrolase, partial [Neocallimastix sp. 'constans']
IPILLVAEDYPEDIADGLNEIAQHYIHQNFKTRSSIIDNHQTTLVYDNQWRIKFIHDNDLEGGKLIVNSNFTNFREVPSDEVGLQITVKYYNKIEAFRALGRILKSVYIISHDEELFKSGEVESYLNFEEMAQFHHLGTMVDCSRSCVANIDTIFYLLRTCALLGINCFQLYTEDTYKIENEPFFGYMRGGYTEDELVMIDDYAYNLGIEVFPCIQTLGHLGQILQWPYYANVRDTSEVLLVEYEETYQLIEKMIRTVTKPFRSKLIHIGMDEAHGLGEGRYRQIFGNRKENSQVFLEHLQRVSQICKNLGKTPLIWSDMLFCLAGKNNSLAVYYDNANPLSSEQALKIPPEVNLIYWDYYHVNTDFYSHKIKHHRELGCEPWFAGGIWTWNRFWAALPFSFHSGNAALQAVKSEGVKNTFVTIWGDDGNEFDMYSLLPGLILYGEHGYTPNHVVSLDTIKTTFGAICGGDLDAWMEACKLDHILPSPYPSPSSSVDSKLYFPPNTSKWILWMDPIYAFLSPQYGMFDLEKHYLELSNNLKQAMTADENKYPLNKYLEFPVLLAYVLSLKVNLRKKLEEAYKAGDLVKLQELYDTDLTLLCENTKKLWKLHRDNWLGRAKPFGCETVELRYGGLIIRLNSLYDRIKGYLDHKYSSIPEFESPPMMIYENAGPGLLLDYSRAATPSRAFGAG